MGSFAFFGFISRPWHFWAHINYHCDPFDTRTPNFYFLGWFSDLFFWPKKRCAFWLRTSLYKKKILLFRIWVWFLDPKTKIFHSRPAPATQQVRFSDLHVPIFWTLCRIAWKSPHKHTHRRRPRTSSSRPDSPFEWNLARSGVSESLKAHLSINLRDCRWKTVISWFCGR